MLCEKRVTPSVHPVVFIPGNPLFSRPSSRYSRHPHPPQEREGNGKWTKHDGSVEHEGAFKADKPAGQPAGGAYAHDAGAFARLAADVARVVEEGVAPVVAAVAKLAK